MKMIKFILVSVILLSLCSSLQSLYIAEAEFPVAVDMECVQKTDKVLCQFDFTNVAQQDYYLMKRHTPLEGLYSPFLTVKQGDQLIQYQGYVAYRLPATKNNYVLIQAGSTVYSPMIELTRAYKLPRDGVYTVEYTGQLSVIPGDTMSLLQDTELTWNHIMNNEGRVKASSHISVADSHNLQILEAEETSKLSINSNNVNSPQARISETCKAPVFRGQATDQQIQDVRNRHEQLCEYLPCVLGTLSKGPSALTKKWFGDVSSAIHILTSGITDIQYKLLNDEIIYQFGAVVCTKNPDWAAASFINTASGVSERRVDICPPYFTLHDVCTGGEGNTKESAIFHEFTHMFANTEDVAYSVDDCSDLAKKRLALGNANNWSLYYCELINHQKKDCVIL